MSCVGFSVPSVSWVGCELLAYVVSNSIEGERVLPRAGDKPLTPFVSPALIWKEPMHETKAVPENRINARLQCCLFLNTDLCQLFSPSPLLRPKVSRATCELLPWERKRKEITHHAQLSRPSLVHRVYESPQRDGSLMVTRHWHPSKLGFLFQSRSLDICKQDFLWAREQSCFCLVGLYWKSPFAGKCQESSS